MHSQDSPAYRRRQCAARESFLFLYLCLGAQHAPHHAPKSFIDKYVPVFEKGWDVTRTRGGAVASEAFFPFPDGLLAAAEAGATSVIQPGGSVNDRDVIAAADEAGLAMVFTGMRHFRH